MICRLNEDQIKNLFAAVHGSIIASKNSNGVYNPQEFIKGLYNTITQTGKLDQSGAIDYVQHIPQMIIQSFANFDDSKQHLRKSKVSLDDLSQLDEDFNSDVNNILQFLGLTITPSSIIEEIKETSNPSDKVASTQTYSEIESKDKEIKSSIPDFKARPESALALTNQEAKDYNGVNAKENILDTDPAKTTYFATVRRLNSMLNDLNQETADNLQISPNVKGVFLRLVSGESIPNDQVQESDRQYGLNNRMVFVYTDKNGEYIYFNSEGVPTTKELGGRIAYGSMRSIEKDSVESVQSIEEVAKSRNISLELAQAIRNQEINIMQKSREFVKNNPDSVLLFSIKPGKNGYVNENYAIRNKISSYNIKGGFKPWVAREEQPNVVKGGVYFNVEGYDLPVLIGRPKFNEIDNGSFTEAIADVIFNSSMSNIKKIEFLKQFTHKDDTAIYEEEGKLFIKQNGKVIDVSDVNQKEQFIENLNSQVLNINKDLIGANMQYPTQSGLVSKSYNTFISDNFYSHLEKNANNEIISLNAYNIAEISGDGINKIFSVEKPDERVEKPSELEKETPTDNPAEAFMKLLNKTDFSLKRSKAIGRTITTEEQILNAKEWYERSEMSKHVPFFVMMNIVNSDAFADFTLAGITLYEGSDFTDLYHEGWHVFSQIFLTKEEKKNLYGEGRKLTGSFKTVTGETIKFSEANDFQLEEFFAEDFRNYSLSDAKSIINGRPVRNTIFRKIYNFLKLLFKGYSVKDIIADSKSVKKINELYNNLYFGNLNSYTPSIENVQFGLLRKGVESIDRKSNEELSYQDSLVLVDTIDSLMASTLSDFNRNVSSIFTNPELIGPLYQKIQYDLSQLRNKLIAELGTISQKPKEDASKYTNHSGGARGADTVWDLLGRAFGVKNHKHYREPGQEGVDSFELQKRGIKSEPISVEDYEEGKQKATIAAEQLGRKISKDYAHYQYRNWAQVKYADAIFAVGVIENIVDKNTKKKIPTVKGGTGYAVQMAINEGKPVYVFDEKTAKWYKMGKSKYSGEQIAVETETPVLTKNYAGIGSRNDITQVGRDAIKEVYNKTFGKVEESVSKNNALKIIDFALENWGDFSKVAKGEESKGVIAYHKKKSSYMTFEDKFEEMSPDQKEETNDKQEEKEEGSELAKNEEQLKEEFGSNAFERKGNENSVYEIASKETIYLIKSLQQLEKDGVTPVLNILGVPKLVDFSRAWGHVINSVQGSKDITTMYKRLMQDSSTFPELKQLAERLGDPSLYTEQKDWAHIKQWLSFFKDFSVYKIPIKEVRVVKNESNFSVEFTESSPQFRQAEQSFIAKFQSLQTKGKYVRRTSQGNVLDVKAILNDFTIGSLDNSGVAFEFLKAVGLYLTDNKQIRNKIAEKREIVKYIYMGLQNINAYLDKNPQSIVTNPLNALRDSKQGNSSGRVTEILEIEAKYSGRYSNNSIKNVKGDNEYDLSLNNSITKLLIELNASQSYDVFNLPHMEHLNYRKNPNAKYSILLNSMFDYMTGSKKQESSEQNASNVSMNIINLNGIKSIIQGADQSQFEAGGIKTTDVDISTKFLMDLHTMLLEGTIELPRHASKSTAYGVGTSRIYTDYNQNARHLYISSGLFADQSAGLDAAVSLIIPKLAAELERIAILKSGEITNIPGFSERGLDLVMFDDIIGDQQLRKELIENADKNDSLSVVKNDKFRNRVSSEIKKYLNALYLENMNIYKDMPFISESILVPTGKNKNKNVKDLVKLATGQDISDRKRLTEIAMASFTVNALIHNMEMVSVLYGDLAVYNHIKEDFHKRNASIGSTGRSFAADENIYKFINNLGRPYAKKLGVEARAFDGVINTVVFKDNDKLSSNYLSEYMEVFKEKFGEEAAEKILTPYKEMNEGDAQGWLTFDAYRVLCILESNWSEDQNRLYNDIIEGKQINPEDIAEFFPPKKYQYAGPLKTDKLHVQAFHKYSLAPLIPSVIKGTNLETLHNNLVKQNVDYAVFVSGSKLGTLTKDGKPDNFYDNNDKNARNIKEWNEGDVEYTKNQIFLQYLKSQVDIHTHWKEKTVFSTQLRKLIINDMFEQGNPLSQDMKRMVKNFEYNLDLLQNSKKQQLLKEAGWKEDQKGELNGSMRSLMEFVERELTRLDLPEHDIDFVRNGLKTGKFDDLSFSLNSEKIEKLLNSVIVKRLVRQKLKGEQLIQTSGAGFEAQSSFRNPTQKDLNDYGTNGLPTYRPGKGKNGATTAMKVKVAMKGDYYKLLNLKDKEGNKIGTIERLNDLLKDDEWLDIADNRKMVTLVGVRIPVQGFNSMEFMEIYEFLPEEAGNIIIPPSEIVAKSGSDFDIDKLTIFEPNYSYKVGDVLVSDNMLDAIKKEFPSEKDITKEFIENIINKLESENPEDITKEERKIYKFILKNTESIPEYSKGDDSKSIENKVIENIREILEHPDNFIALVRPNETDLVKGVANDLSKENIQGYDHLANKNKTKTGKISPTRVLEPRYNLYKHESNNIGKKTLGIGAVDNTYSAIFKRIGLRLRDSYSYVTSKGGTHSRDVRILMDHNSFEFANKKFVSFSNIYTKTNDKISDLIGQLMNGWVDIEKEAWIFNINGNNKAGPVLLFLLEAGVDFRTAAYFVSQPLVVAYIKHMTQADSPFFEASGKGKNYTKFKRFNLRKDFIDQYIHPLPLIVNKRTGEIIGKKFSNPDFDDLVNEYTNNITEFNQDDLLNNIKSKDIFSKEAKAAFLHFMELENLMSKLTNIKLKVNVDTAPSKSLFAAQKRLVDIEELKEEDVVPSNTITNIFTKSPIRSFFIQSFQLQILKNLLKVRSQKSINEFLMGKLKDKIVDNTVIPDAFRNDDEKFVAQFHNDIPLYLLQNELKNIDLENLKVYKGSSVKKATPIKYVNLSIGAFVKDDIMYLDVDQLKRDFASKAFAGESYVKQGLAKVDSLMFSMGNSEQNFKEYAHFVIEREHLRSVIPIAENQTREQYEEMLMRKSLENTYNFYYMLKTPDYCIADEFMSIKNNYPQLSNMYLLLDDAIGYVNDSIKNDKDGNITYDKNTKAFRTLKFVSSRVDKDTINVLHENLIRLSDPKTVKVVDPEENLKISNFFKRFIINEYLRAGVSKSADNLSRILPPSVLMRLLDKPMREINKKGMTYEQVASFYSQFSKNWNDGHKKSRNKFRNYIATEVKKKENKVINKKEEIDKLPPIEQNFADGSGGRKMQPQFAGKSTMDLILSGDRTRTTRANTDINRMIKDYGLSKIEDLVGRIIRMTDKNSRVAYTRITNVTPFTQEYQDQTWQKEGWEKSVTDKHVGNYPYAIEFKLINVKDQQQSESDELFLSENQKTKLISYPVEDLNPATIRQYLDVHPDDIFVFPDVTHEKIVTPEIKEFRKGPNSVGLPVAESSSKSWKDATFEENKKAIDERIDELENHMINGKHLIFPIKGITAIANKENLKTNAPQTFYYFAEQLYKRLGYKIEGLAEDKQYKMILQAGQEITDEDVERLIKEGFAIKKPLNIVQREDINQVFKDFPELEIVGTREQFTEYLKTIFPSSKINDILYHGGTATPFNKNEMTNIDTETGIYLAKNLNEAKDYAEKHGHLYSVVINMTNPISLDDARRYGGVSSISVSNEAEAKLIKDGYDGINQLEGTESVYAVVFKPEQIHIIDKNDIEKFKEFVKGEKKEEQPSTTMTLKDGKSYSHFEINTEMLTKMGYNVNEIMQILNKIC